MKNNTLLLFYFYSFIFIIILFFLLALALLEQPSIQRYTSCCKLCDCLENASFKTNDLRRPWCAMVLSDIHRDARASISPGHLVQGPRRSHGFIE